jgi:hypothetical protein
MAKGSSSWRVTLGTIARLGTVVISLAIGSISASLEQKILNILRRWLGSGRMKNNVAAQRLNRENPQ